MSDEQHRIDTFHRLGSIRAAARELGMDASALRRWLKTRGISSQHKGGSGESVKLPDVITHTLPEHPKRESTRTPDEAMRDHGFDPDLFQMVTLGDNYWTGGDGENLTQSKITVRPRLSPAAVLPRYEPGYTRKPIKPRKITAKRPWLEALPSDQHCPHEDPGLDSCWQQWLAVNQPGGITGLGDLGNMSKPSRHRANLSDEFNDTPNENAQGAYNWWRRTIDAHGGKFVGRQLPGNHDLRIAIATAERLPEMYDFKYPGAEYPWHDLTYVYGLDALGIEYVRPRGEYHHAEVQIAPGLSVTHGAHAGVTGGAHKAGARHEGSRAQGHDHKQAVTHVVRYRDGHAHVHVQVSGGAMCKRDLGYTPDPDTQQGFATVTVHHDGYWNIELARYDDRRGVLVWRDQRYEAA